LGRLARARYLCPRGLYAPGDVGSGGTNRRGLGWRRFRGRGARLARLAVRSQFPLWSGARSVPCPRASPRPRGDCRAWQRRLRACVPRTVNGTSSSRRSPPTRRRSASRSGSCLPRSSRRPRSTCPPKQDASPARPKTLCTRDSQLENFARSSIGMYTFCPILTDVPS
jgi:hypothetical protein